MAVHMTYLNDIRESANKSQRDVSRDLSMSLSTINRHERGKTPLNDLHRLGYAAYYGVAPDEIEQPSHGEGRKAA
jgi:transcriptional regulator with XRE-family HTH domain